MNLLHFLGWYLWGVFGLGVILRIRQYKSLIGLIWLFPGRWPKLLELVKRHRRVLVTWKTVLPGIATLALSISHMIVFRLLWPEADITTSELLTRPIWLALVVGLGLIMIAFDLYSALRVNKWDRAAAEKQFDSAEYWLKSWSAPVVRVLSLGFVNPRKLVGSEIRKALEDASQKINFSLWWICLQVLLRLAFGASLWLAWAFGK